MEYTNSWVELGKEIPAKQLEQILVKAAKELGLDLSQREDDLQTRYKLGSLSSHTDTRGHSISLSKRQKVRGLLGLLKSERVVPQLNIFWHPGTNNEILVGFGEQYEASRAYVEEFLKVLSKYVAQP